MGARQRAMITGRQSNNELIMAEDKEVDSQQILLVWGHYRHETFIAYVLKQGHLSVEVGLH